MYLNSITFNIYVFCRCFDCILQVFCRCFDGAVCFDGILLETGLLQTGFHAVGHSRVLDSVLARPVDGDLAGIVPNAQRYCCCDLV